ncbi:MAG: type II toxin-antitoxin system RelE/ParE family toxin [Candidatus Vogelbacteria bacterium]|nr:type II toxin-antitoxin system RelE/ParE family toxin [Candidatus Vogelbacteria bacterium]
MNWVLLVDPAVRKFLKKVQKNQAEKIGAVIDSFILDPYFGDIEKMSGGEDTWRRRVGSYRIFYKIFPIRNLVFVFKIKRRTSSTY